MKRVLLPAAAVLALAGVSAVTLVAQRAHAVTGGDLGVLPKGDYVCELPGDAADPGIAGGRHQPESDFSVVGDSSYRAHGRGGVYLLTDNRVTMTSGPLRGRRFHVAEHSLLRETKADGTDGDLRCIASIQAIGLDPPEGRRCKARRPQDTMARSGVGASGTVASC